MNVGGIDQSRILAMMEQLKAAAQKPAGAAAPEQAVAEGGKLDFGAALKNSLQSVSDQQAEASRLGRAFTMGDNSVSLADVMITAQKASINFQATVQVRNKLVSAYHEIMNMQV